MKTYNIPSFRIGMTAPEVIVEIIEAHPEISSLMFEIYASKKNLELEPVIQILTSLERMVYHKPFGLDKAFWLKRSELTVEYLNRRINELSEKDVLAVTSRVKIGDAEDLLQIPMMDFRCAVTEENLEKLCAFFRHIGRSGAILISGKSYHFYGSELVSEKEWFEFMGKCLLLVDCTDTRYVGHRLIDGHCTLRISKEIRRPRIPWVTAIV